MSTPLRVLVRPLSTPSPARILRACPKAAAAFSTARPVCLHAPLRQQTPTLAIKPKAIFTRANRDLPSAARRVHDAAASKPASSTPPASAAEPAIDWNTFFKLRLRRRRIQLVFSVATGVAGLFAGAGLLSSGYGEPLVAQVPLDPFVTLGIMTFACGALGWLAGPAVGGQVFYLSQSRLAASIRRKESEFLTRVKRHRADPTQSSTGNPGTLPPRYNLAWT